MGAQTRKRTSGKPKMKFNTKLCENDMTFEECELTILRHAVDETEKLQGRKKVNSKDIQKMLTIVEDFIIKKKLISVLEMIHFLIL